MTATGDGRHAGPPPDPPPLSSTEFAALLDPLGPFESAPRLAVAVSGGADSLTLAWLAHGWARARGGAAVGLTVDHGLRPEATAEAAQVGRWLAAWGMAHHTLRWTGPRPDGDIQAAARTARYGLLAEWCRADGVLHLLLAHHQDDQAETVLLRLGRGSGVDGLSAMAPVGERPEVRLLRPLLTVPRARLAATLRAAGQPWIEDPSNTDPAYARVRLRRLLPELAAEGLTTERLAATAGRLRQARAMLEDQAARAAARHVTLHPTGWAELDLAALHLPEETALRLLGRLLMLVSGAPYPPRRQALAALADSLRQSPSGRSLAGCLIDVRQGRLRLMREPAAAAPPLTVRAGRAEQTVAWDGRFRLTIAGPEGDAAELRALGAAGWREIAGTVTARPPRAVRETIPALVANGPILAVPWLGYKRDAGWTIRHAVWAPAIPLTAVGHCLV